MAQGLVTHSHSYKAAAGCFVVVSGVLGLLLLPSFPACWQLAKAIHRTGLRRLIYHFRKVKKLKSCRFCARVILPQEAYKLCGCCELLCCVKCSQGEEAFRHKHVLHHEVQPLVVDTEPLAAAKSVGQALTISFGLYSSRPCLGWRADNATYAWHSYGEVGHMAGCFATGLQGLLQGLRSQGKPIVGILSAVSIPWFTVDFACSLAAIPLVTMHRATGEVSLAHILDKTGLCVLVASKHLLPVIYRACSAASALRLRAVIWINDASESYCLQHSARPLSDWQSTTNTSALQQKCFEEILRDGSDSPLTQAAFREPNCVAKLLPSSGSTGVPKLAVVTEEALLKNTGQRFESPQG